MESHPEPAGVGPHLWLENTLSVTESGADTVTAFPGKLERNLHAFADRTGHALVYTAAVSAAAVEPLAERLRVAARRGVEVWLCLWADPQGPTDRELVEDDAAMADFLGDLRSIVEAYADCYPGGRVLLFHEFFGNWTGESTADLAESLLEYGPELFARQRAVIRAVDPGVEVGIFPRHTVQAPPEYTTKSVFAPLMDRLRERGALPDFTYLCSYRGYEDWDAGYAATNGYHRAVVEHCRAATDGRPVYLINQAHTVNNGYTPSKLAVLGSLRTALGAGCASVGLFNRPNHVPTHRRCYRPFLPTTGEIEDTQGFTSFTGWRDRMTWAALLQAEYTGGYDPAGSFDLWVYGENLQFHGTALSLRTADGDWKFVGDVSGYVPGEYPHAPAAGARAVAVHALDRERFLDGQETLEVRLEGDQDDAATVRAVHAVSHLRARDYRPELAITDLYEERDVGPHALGGWEGAVRVARGDVREVDLELGDGNPGHVRDFLEPPQRETLESLERSEDDPGFDPCERFDLWVYGEGLDALEVSLGRERIDDASDDGVPDQFGHTTRQYVGLDGDADAGSTGAGEGGEALVFRGLDREEFWLPRGDPRHAHGSHLELQVAATGGTEVHAVYAMPHHGPDAFSADVEVAAAVKSDFRAAEGQLTTFALGHQVWPGGLWLDGGDTAETWVQLFDRRANVVQNVE